MEEIICTCMQIPKEEIVDAILEYNLKTVEEIREETFANTACGKCYEKVKEILETTKVKQKE